MRPQRPKDYSLVGGRVDTRGPAISQLRCPRSRLTDTLCPGDNAHLGRATPLDPHLSTLNTPVPTPTSVPSGGEAHAEADRGARRGGEGGRGGPTDGQAFAMEGARRHPSLPHTNLFSPDRTSPSHLHLTPSYMRSLSRPTTLPAHPVPTPAGEPRQAAGCRVCQPSPRPGGGAGSRRR